MDEGIEQRRVRFRVYHGGFGANVGDCRYVARDWAGEAIASGIVEDAPEPSEAEPKPAS